MQYYYNIKLAETLNGQFESLKTVQLLTEAFELRIESEQQYQKGITKVANKLSNVKTSAFSALVNELARMHVERSYQINTFKSELRAEVGLLRERVKRINHELENKQKQLKKIERDLKINFEKVEKSRIKVTQANREIDEKIILNEITRLNCEQTHEQLHRISETNAKLLTDQKQLSAQHSITIQSFQKIIKQINSEIPNIAKEVTQLIVQLRSEYFDLLKKYTVHEISMLRNMQYDLDSTFRKIETEETVSTTKEKVIDSINGFQENTEEEDWNQLKLKIMLYTYPTTQEHYEEDLKALFDRAVFEDKQDLDLLLARIQNDYPKLKWSLQKCIESYRLANKFQFEEQPYNNLACIFKAINQSAYKLKDIELLQKLLLFTVTYYKVIHNEKRYLFEDIKSLKFYGLLEFWRFYTYFSIRNSLNNYRKNLMQQGNIQNSVHEKNSVYSTLLTCSSNMVHFGIEKHSAKNFIAKAGKSFQLPEHQISDIIKFIDMQFGNQKKTKEMEHSPKVMEHSPKVVRIGR